MIDTVVFKFVEEQLLQSDTRVMWFSSQVNVEGQILSGGKVQVLLLELCSLIKESPLSRHVDGEIKGHCRNGKSRVNVLYQLM